jgi:hypothetical protein
MKKLILLLPLLFIQFATKAQLSKLTFAKKLTKQHTHIVGTEFHVVVPEDYKVVDGMAGITDGGASLLLFTKPPHNPDFSKVSTQDMRKEIEKQGVKVTEVTRLTNVKGQPMILTGQSKVGLVQILLNTPNNAWVILGTFTDEDEKEEIFNCLKTLYVDEGKKVDVNKARKFNIDLSGSNLKFRDFDGTNFQYISTSSSYRQSLVIAQLSTSALDGKTLKKACQEQALTKSAGKKIISEKAVKTKVGEGYLIVTKQGEILSYTLFTSNKQTLLMINARSNRSVSQTKKDFEKLLLEKISLK